MPVEGHFIAAGTSAPESARLGLDGAEWTVETGHGVDRFPASGTRVSDRLARLPRRLDFPGGSQFTSADNDGLDALLDSLGRPARAGLVNRLEARWPWALVALALIPVALFALFTLGMPFVAQQMARNIPSEAMAQIDRSAMQLLDEHLFKESRTGRATQRNIRGLLEHLPQAQLYRLEFRGGGAIGANAFALPAGTIVLTDELLALSDSRGELLAVLAHEAGHIQERHTLRMVIQSAGVAVVMGWLLGDLTAVTDFILVSAPTAIQQMAYSRDFEREADRYAHRALADLGYSPACFGDLMEKLEKQSEGTESSIPRFLLSHPSTQERVQASRGGAACPTDRLAATVTASD